MWAVASHCGRTCGHIFGFRCRHSNWGRHGRVCFDESTVVENHVADGGAASVRTILPTGVGENGEIGIWDAMVKADVVDGVGGAIGIKFKCVVGAAAKVANEPGESSEVSYLLSQGRCKLLWQVCRQQKGYWPVCCRRGKEEYTRRSGRGGVVVSVQQG
jgi:hypothetical protein